jgi:hypothetical protein
MSCRSMFPFFFVLLFALSTPSFAATPASSPTTKPGPAPKTAPGDQPLVWYLCPHDVAAVSVEQPKWSPGKFAVSVALRREASERFMKFTKDHMFQDLEIHFDNAVLARAPIRMPSGSMVLPQWGTKSVAERIGALVTDATLNVPCGAK